MQIAAHHRAWRGLLLKTHLCHPVQFRTLLLQGYAWPIPAHPGIHCSLTGLIYYRADPGCPGGVFGGLLTDVGALSAATAALDHMYTALHDSLPPGTCEVDERPFIEGLGGDDAGRGAEIKGSDGAANGRLLNGGEHANGLLGSPFRFAGCTEAVWQPLIGSDLCHCKASCSNLLFSAASPGHSACLPKRPPKTNQRYGLRTCVYLLVWKDATCVKPVDLLFVCNSPF